MSQSILRHFSSQKNQLTLLLVATICLLFGMLDTHDLWTQEHRWADIVSGMFYRHDFFHPYLGEADYYDKPLLSYWLVATFSWLEGEVTLWALRAPSAFAGLLAVWSIYRLGTKLKNPQFGLLSGWMLLTTFYFIFWSRTSSADMLNMAGTLFAVSWYYDKRDKATFFDFTIFFLILALTSLCKGLVAAVVAVLAILPDLISENRWKRYLRLSVFLSLIPATIIYLLPFYMSTVGNGQYGESGLYLVYRENFLRYFQPFDHKDPIYTYFIYLPIYLLPWAFFFIPALLTLKTRWRTMTTQSKSIVWSVLLLFIFFTLSGSRRSYYVLPIVPFAILLTADWILANADRIRWATGCIKAFFIIFILNFVIVQPLYYTQSGIQKFTSQFNHEVKQLKIQSLQIVMLDPQSKISYYLHLAPTVKYYGVVGAREQQTLTSLIAVWPELKARPQNVIILSRAQYEPILTPYLKKDYKLLATSLSWADRLLQASADNLPIAYIPKHAY